MFATVALIASALLLICVSSLKFASNGLLSTRVLTRALRRRALDMRELRDAAEAARLKAKIETTKESGMNWRVMEVAELVDESNDCRSFYLVDPYGQELPSFRPGQYLMIRPALAGAYQTTRCYSLSSSPNGRYWRITVKRQEFGKRPPTLPVKNGGLSQWLHRNIKVGDCLLVGEPSGHFFLPAENKRPLVLLAAGVGITPMASMLRWSLEVTPNRPVALLYQVKDFRHWPLGENLHRWQQDFQNIRLLSFMSRSDESELADARKRLPGEFVSGKFDFFHALKVLPNPEQNDYFMCGPEGWMQSLREGLIEAGVPESQVHWESFGGTGAQPAAANAGSVESTPVRFEHSDVDAVWEDAEKTLFELARDNDVEIPSGCMSGVCGSCKVKLLKGTVEYDRDVSVELAKDECLTCVTRPKCAVVIDA